MTKLAKPKAIIWDWDGTVVSTYEVIRHALVLTLEHFKVTGAKYEVAMQGAGKKAMRDFFPEVFGTDWEKAGEVFYDNFEKTHLEKLEVLPKADEVIKFLGERYVDIYMAVVSNKRGDLLRKEVKHLGLESYFKKVVGATDCPRDKPDIAPLVKALEGSGVSPGPEVYIIGDSAPDLQLAVNSSSRAIFFGDASIDPKYDGVIMAKIGNHSQLFQLFQQFN